MKTSPPEVLRKMLKPEVLNGELDEELEVNRKALLSALRSGESIWRAPEKSKK